MGRVLRPGGVFHAKAVCGAATCAFKEQPRHLPNLYAVFVGGQCYRSDITVGGALIHASHRAHESACVLDKGFIKYGPAMRGNSFKHAPILSQARCG